MFPAFLVWILKYKWLLLFYLVVIIFFWIKRKQVEVQAKIIFLLRTSWGISFINYCGQKWREWIILLGYVGVGAGYVGLVFISFVLIKNLYSLITAPAAVAGVSLVYPGMTVPGLGVLSVWDFLFSLFFIAVIHEFSHGIVARAHEVSVKNTGIAFFGPLPAAFVEPDEKKLRKEKDIVQYSVLAAGSFSNILLAIVAVVVLFAAVTPLQQNMVSEKGFTFDTYVEGDFPFAQAGILPGTLITGLNDAPTKNFQAFAEELAFHRPAETISVQTNKGEYTVTLAKNPDNIKKSFLGIKEIHDEHDVKQTYQSGWGKALFVVISWLAHFLKWLYLLSLSIGLFNLLPLPIVDGGRMAQVFLHKLHGAEIGEKRYRRISLFFLLLILLNLFYPLLMKLF
ncbi:site-2 protease family protein [Candidatus Woesearchaeota archaeon]|nr:site-2 protease family protein [Candidatus Woesearchaeota archaeon]